VRSTCAVAPLGLTATTLSTLVPFVTGIVTLKLPSEPGVAVVVVVALLSSVFVAPT